MPLLPFSSFFSMGAAGGLNPAGPPEQTQGQSIKNASKFNIPGLVTVAGNALPGSAGPFVAGLPCICFADYSLFCPLLGTFLPPEKTNFASLTDGGSGS